ncbi:MAG: RsmE family RNA methyltransferase [Gemmatimonadales bacterium]
MERHNRAGVGAQFEIPIPVASFYAAPPLIGGAKITLAKSAAHHVLVKRLEVGNIVRLADGAGHVAFGAIEELSRERATVALRPMILWVTPPSPIHVCVPVGDRDRMLWLAEKAAELGVASWRPVMFHRSSSVSPRGEGEAFARKVEARMIGALEQSGGDWLPRILPTVSVAELAVDGAANRQRIVLDRAGDPLLDVLGKAAAREPELLFGPEGGIDDDERTALRNADWRLARLADNTLRFETAGVAAIAVIRAAQLSGGK